MVDLSSFSVAIVHPVAIRLLKHLKPAQGQQSFVLSAVGFNLALHQIEDLGQLATAACKRSLAACEWEGSEVRGFRVQVRLTYRCDRGGHSFKLLDRTDLAGA